MDTKNYDKLAAGVLKKMTKSLAESSDTNFAILKVAEESSELLEVTLKTLSKPEDKRPPLEMIIEEAGDVLARIGILAVKLNIEDEIFQRAENKIQLLHEAMLEGKLGAKVTIERI